MCEMAWFRSNIEVPRERPSSLAWAASYCRESDLVASARRYSVDEDTSDTKQRWALRRRVPSWANAASAVSLDPNACRSVGDAKSS